VSGNLKFSSSAPTIGVPRRPNFANLLGPNRLGLTASIDWPIVATIAILIVIGFSLRFNQLGAIGFAEDEMNKLDAIHSYERGDFSANAEHPMLMKLWMWMSLRTAPTRSEEVALRLPNVVVGTLTVIPLFLLASALFERKVALLAAAFWAVGVNAITHNRIGKEDSLLVFFLLFGFYFFIRAKQTSPVDQKTRKKNYAGSAIAFGLMIASKYFPHFLGLNMLFHHKFHVRKAVAGEPGGKTPGWFFLLIVVVILAASPAVLMPQVWHYVHDYMGEKLLTHSGYLFAGRLYKNNMSSTPFWGTPPYFYLLFLAIKVPLMIVAGLLIGFVVSIRNRRAPAYAFLIFMFLFWLIPYSLLGGKWLRYTLSVMPFVYLLAAVGVSFLIKWSISRFPNWKAAPSVFTTAAVVLFVVIPAWSAFAVGPHYALYTNALAAGQNGFYFPHDEFYDDGLREGIEFVCTTAPNGATIAHETPAVARYYLERFNRTDLSSYPISAKDFDVTKVTEPTYVIVQRGRTYFENRDELDYVRNNFLKVYEVRINGAIAVEVFVNQKPRTAS
jgi:hypothetical protein